MSLAVADHTSGERARAIRERLRRPQNAKIDQGIALHHPKGVNGVEAARIRRELALASFRKARDEREAKRLADALAAHAKSEQPPRDWLIVSLSNYRENHFPPRFFEQILWTVAQFFNVRCMDIIGPSRLVEHARPRHLVVYFARQYTTKSFPQIMRKLGDRDHTCGCNSVKRINELKICYPPIKSAVEELDKIFQEKIIEWRGKAGTQENGICSPPPASMAYLPNYILDTPSLKG